MGWLQRLVRSYNLHFQGKNKITSSFLKFAILLINI